MKLQPVRGTKDLFLDDAAKHLNIIKTARETSSQFGFGSCEIPVFEFTEVFARTLGETSDVVNKEMYTFSDRGGESLTLRPEFTAGIARAFISEGLQQNLPLRLFTAGPLFRYERPQKGRQRQFHQIDAEILGEAGYQADVEIISLGAEILNKLGLLGKVRLEINSLGDSESRAKYTSDLVAYLKKHEANLSEDSKRRLESNPLRVLDSKDEGDRKINENAPLLSEYLSVDARNFYNNVLNSLRTLLPNLEVRENPKLVRGLDYYNHTVFEFISVDDSLGSQNTVLAGGRYDGLIKQMGGSDVPAVGFGAGIERLALMISADLISEQKPVAVIALGEKAELEAMKIASKLRSMGKSAVTIFSNKLAKALTKADKFKACSAYIIGEDELARNIAIHKDMENGTQNEVEIKSII